MMDRCYGTSFTRSEKAHKWIKMIWSRYSSMCSREISVVDHSLICTWKDDLFYVFIKIFCPQGDRRATPVQETEIMDNIPTRNIEYVIFWVFLSEEPSELKMLFRRCIIGYWDRYDRYICLRKYMDKYAPDAMIDPSDRIESRRSSRFFEKFLEFLGTFSLDRDWILYFIDHRWMWMTADDPIMSPVDPVSRVHLDSLYISEFLSETSQGFRKSIFCEGIHRTPVIDVKCFHRYTLYFKLI